MQAWLIRQRHDKLSGADYWWVQFEEPLQAHGLLFLLGYPAAT